MSKWPFLLLFCLWWACLWSPSSSAASFTERYDADIKRSVDRYWTDFPHWLWWKAQMIQESGLNPGAVSPVGAQGIAQIMPGTWKDLVKLAGVPGALSPYDARTGIQLGALYQMQRRTAWGTAGRTGEQRNALGQAAYNAGMGNILKAQKLCQDARLWDDIAPCLSQVTGEKNSAETQGYVRNIAKWHGQLEKR